MPVGQDEHWDNTTSLELDIRKKPQSTVAVEKTVRSYASTPVTDAKAVAQFRFRILVVDDEPSLRETARQMLESGGYEVLTVADGLEGLHALSKSLPDLIISDLNMPRMSGFEFLAVVRERFPHIATIAVSGDYIAIGNPSGVLADAFLQKGHYTLNELCREVAKLLAASPIRSERQKSEIAPLFVPRDKAGYLIITCPKCLRPNRLEAMSLNGGLHETPCQSCGTPVKFEINHEIATCPTLNSRIIGFYSGTEPDHRGRSLHEIQQWADDKLEAVHDYIQWLFPLPDPSGFNAAAPILTRNSIQEFRRRPELRQKVRVSFLRMMNFYGMEVYSGERLRVNRAPNFAGKAKVWLSPGNHNYLRITRILSCLSRLGLEAEAKAFLDCLAEIYKSELHKPVPAISDDTMLYWRGATSHLG
jgi:CheY-like chemotaxis protein